MSKNIIALDIAEAVKHLPDPNNFEYREVVVTIQSVLNKGCGISPIIRGSSFTNFEQITFIKKDFVDIEGNVKTYWTIKE